MDYGEALNKIESLDNGSELISAIKARIDGILDEKRRAISSSSSSSDRASQLETIVEQIFTLTGAQGNDPVSRAKAFTTKYNSLLSESTNNQKTISNLETAKNAAEQAKQLAETKLIEADRSIKITEAAIASKANPTVLKKLLTDSSLALELSTGEDNTSQVLVVNGDTKLPLNEYAQSNWADFIPSLFPSNGSVPPKPPTTLPSGSPGGKPQPTDPVRDYIAAAGYGLKKAQS